MNVNRFRLGSLIALLAVIPCLAQAGKNAGGALIVHTNDAVMYRYPNPLCNPEYEPTSCEGAVTRSEASGNFPTVTWFLAAFPDGSEPAVTELRFGVRHGFPPGQGYCVGWMPCGPNVAVDVTEGFPDTPGGARIAYLDVVRDPFFPVCFFGFWALSGSYLGTGPDPRTGEAHFVDDLVPITQDGIERFGEVRWYDDGYNDCPSAEVAACCLPNGFCVMQPTDVCIEEGGDVLPDDACTPGLCAPDAFGACCLDDLCLISAPQACEDAGGVFQGIASTCDPNPCFLTFGACCVEGVCSYKTRLQCGRDGGEWLGYIPCDPVDPCPLAGACCMPDGSCTLSLDQDCLYNGGTWTDSGVPCVPNPCPTAVQPTTWGRIRATYR
ncbi:MAG: hypothetical protein QUU85_13330 [Candidatus Eisenbacteria bacterium]|nr:hypothetical protein [Candidatus Eisenbacteria bacterium]